MIPTVIKGCPGDILGISWGVIIGVSWGIRGGYPGGIPPKTCLKSCPCSPELCLFDRMLSANQPRSASLPLCRGSDTILLAKQVT